jgi:uncharacterized Zn finger protein
MAARQKPSFEQRVSAYVDSPLVTMRIVCGPDVCARFVGNFGTYRVRVSKSKRLAGECTCPSELRPCKHVHALRATWEANPRSFFDLDPWLKQLAKEPKVTLVEAIENMVVDYPELLSVFGVPGFDIEDDEYSDEYYD